jgi:phosphate uptake regulator
MASIRSSLSEAARTSEVVPSYVDLLFVVRVLELERIGDHARNIAKDSFWRDQAGEIRDTYRPKMES